MQLKLRGKGVLDMEKKEKSIPSDFVDKERLHDRTEMHKIAFRKDMKDVYKKFLQQKMKK